MRWIRHLFDLSSAKRHFPPATLDSIQRAIAASEHRHLGEIVFAVEGSLPLAEAVRKRTPRERAHEVFARLHVWNTEHNTGVLVYILLAEHAIEIVADRAVAAKIDQAQWQPICAVMQQHFSAGDYERGAVAGVAAIGELLIRHFPANGEPKLDELPDRPILL
ncbi:TPM domain-containing protein [Dokdonella soli]|uniref:TPM domain-containing protein n=1 Tax=Dokdonella soli TaxID=529810 RepID=A0ABN1IW11_9GAMM